MGKGIVRGSSSFLFFGEEYGYGVPDWNYDVDANENTVASRVSPGDTDLTLSSNITLAVGDWIAVYSGQLTIPTGGSNRPGCEGDDDGIDLIQAFKIGAVTTADTSVTLDDDTLPRFAIRKGDKVRKLLGANDEERFRVDRVHVGTGLVSMSLSVEIGEIPDESLAFAASGGSRVRGKSRRGGITGDGGNFVVQPGTSGYASLLRHALGDRVYYGSLDSSFPATGAVATTLDADRAKVDTGTVAITVQAGGGTAFATGDIVQIGTGESFDLVVLIAKAAGTVSINAANTPLLYDHDDDEDVRKVEAGALVNLAANYQAGVTAIAVDGTIGSFSVGDRAKIGIGDSAEIVTLTASTATLLTFANHPLRHAHLNNEFVVKVVSDKPIPHELRKGDLPQSMTLYQWSDDLESVWVVPGCKIGSFDLSAANEESTIKSTFNTIVRSAQLLESLPFTRPTGKTQAPYTNFELILSKEDTRIVGLNSVTINGDNEITPLKAINAVGTYGSAAEGTGRWTTDFNYQLRNTARFKETVEGTEADWTVGITYDIGSASNDFGAGIEFEFPGSTLTGNILPNIEDSGASSSDGTLLTGQHDTKATNVVCVVTANEGRI